MLSYRPVCDNVELNYGLIVFLLSCIQIYFEYLYSYLSQVKFSERDVSLIFILVWVIINFCCKDFYTKLSENILMGRFNF